MLRTAARPGKAAIRNSAARLRFWVAASLDHIQLQSRHPGCDVGESRCLDPCVSEVSLTQGREEPPGEAGGVVFLLRPHHPARFLASASGHVNVYSASWV